MMQVKYGQQTLNNCCDNQFKKIKYQSFKFIEGISISLDHRVGIMLHNTYVVNCNRSGRTKYIQVG